MILPSSFAIAVALGCVGFTVWRFIRAIRTAPPYDKSDVIYQEQFASGCSQKNILTQFGGARNCLRLVVTRRFLLVTSWFPFSLITPMYDLEHVIPLESIISARRSRYLFQNTFLITYRGADGCEHTLRLVSKRPEDFIRSLGIKVEDEKLT